MGIKLTLPVCRGILSAMYPYQHVGFNQGIGASTGQWNLPTSNSWNGSNPAYPRHATYRPMPNSSAINGVRVYVTGTGEHEGSRADGELVVATNTEVKINVTGHGQLTAGEFAKLARNNYRRPRQQVKLVSSNETLEAFEARQGIIPPGSFRRWDDDGRTSEVDFERRRQLVKAYEKDLRKKQREEQQNKSLDELVPLTSSSSFPAGTWSQCKATNRNDTDEELQKKIDRAHRNWMKNSPLLYDFAMVQALEWPSLTAQWLPEKIEVDADFCAHRLLLGTYCSHSDTKKRKDFLMVAYMNIPRDLSAKQEVNEYEPEGRSHPSENAYLRANVEMETRLLHKGEVNRARYMPQNSSIIATKSGANGEVFLFDIGTQKKFDDVNYCHTLYLRGHNKEGYGLAWNEKKAGYILSGSYDQKVCVWDINGTPEESRQGVKGLEPIHTFKKHSDVVSDVAWHPFCEDTFSSVGDDKVVMMWDMRAGSSPTSIHKVSQQPVNSISFNHINHHLFAIASGSTDSGVVKVWDTRKMDESLFIINSHTDVVDVVSWAPHSQYILASGGRDRKVHILDTSNAPSKRDSFVEDPEELMFVHAGHTCKISDITWNPHDPWLISTVSDLEDSMHVWQMSDEFWAAEKDEVLSEASSYDSDELESTFGSPQATASAKVASRGESSVEAAGGNTAHCNGKGEGEGKVGEGSSEAKEIPQQPDEEMGDIEVKAGGKRADQKEDESVRSNGDAAMELEGSTAEAHQDGASKEDGEGKGECEEAAGDGEKQKGSDSMLE
eukprot:759668-Hanusia_phi.AAC.2